MIRQMCRLTVSKESRVLTNLFSTHTLALILIGGSQLQLPLPKLPPELHVDAEEKII